MMYRAAAAAVRRVRTRRITKAELEGGAAGVEARTQAGSDRVGLPDETGSRKWEQRRRSPAAPTAGVSRLISCQHASPGGLIRAPGL